MNITFKTQKEIFTDMKTQLVAEAPQLTNWRTRGVVRSILTVVSAAISMLWDRLKIQYLDMWAQYSDRTTLRRYYELWGLVWSEDLDTETARKEVLAMYRQKGKGTKAWYRSVVLSEFSEKVTDAAVSMRARGPNTVDIEVSYNGGPVQEDDEFTVADIQDFFAGDENSIVGAEVLVTSVET
ncbi:hypothetical protein GF359_05075 [candidate division WOR-3 bacterium]|uniref:Uncharacterized protein n=1 Tax=candidate division WOR-3 bacterium TaxID=2052148 RepID=A0A9D5K915_UNCW3|nr:hypothetical protein [candidate division WOR-3 bacterium]MBD3364568.1 hypothetical protein [candidate division WOR-3 bacterium]